MDFVLVDDFGQLGPGVLVYLELVSRREVDLPLRVTQSNFAAVDSSGNRLRLYGQVGGNFAYPSFNETYVLTPGEREALPYPGGFGDGLFVAADVFESQLVSITVTVTGISSITDARWELPISH